MKVNLKIMGEVIDPLLRNALDVPSAPSEMASDQSEVEWEITNIFKGFTPADWLCQPNEPTVLIIEADDTILMRNLMSAQTTLHYPINPAKQPSQRCPVILVFKHASSLGHWANLPDFTTDWMLASGVKDEAAMRILNVVKRSQLLYTTHHQSALTLVPATRTMVYENTSARLTPAEYTLLELFLSNIGSIISLQELVQTFRTSGKSAEANNIRVAIYQLRLKLDTLTKSQMPLTSIYRQGYCLRQKLKNRSAQIPLAIATDRHGTQSSA
jgi:DNA-binding winged helix-turn-helix (wHTH) protein